MRISFMPMFLAIASNPALVTVYVMVSALFVAVPSQAMPTKDLQLSLSKIPVAFSIVTFYSNFARNQADIPLGMRTKRVKNEISAADILDRSPVELSSPTSFKSANVDGSFIPLHYQTDNNIRRRFTRDTEGGFDGGKMQEKAMEGAMNGAGMVEGGFGAGESGAKSAKDMTDAGKQIANSAGKGAEMMGSGAEIIEAGMKQGKDISSSMGG